MFQNLLSYAFTTSQPLEHALEITPFRLSDLPQELIDRIVDFLHDDRPALDAVSLSHRSLRPAAIYHLLGLVSIVVGVSKLSALRATLARAPRGFTTGVKTLRLIGDRWLEVQSTDIELFTQFRTTTSLHLCTIAFSSPDGFRELVSGLPALVALRIEGWLNGGQERSEQGSTHSSLIKLQSITLERGWQSVTDPLTFDISYLSLLQWIGSHGTADTLRSLSVRWEVKEDMEATHELLEWAAPNLTELKVRLLGVLIMSDFSSLLSIYPLASMSPINSLTIAVHAMPGSMDTVMQVLEHAHLPSLQTLHITTLGRYMKRIGRYMSLQLVPPIPPLNKELFPELERIELDFPKISEVSGMKALREQFMAMERRGVDVIVMPSDVVVVD